MSQPARNVVQLLETEELTVDVVARRLAYPAWRVYTFIEEARAAGVRVRAIPHPGDRTTFAVDGSSSMEDNRKR